MHAAWGKAYSKDKAYFIESTARQRPSINLKQHKLNAATYPSWSRSDDICPVSSLVGEGRSTHAWVQRHAAKPELPTHQSKRAAAQFLLQNFDMSV
jgi:hypothetical protein